MGDVLEAGKLAGSASLEYSPDWGQLLSAGRAVIHMAWFDALEPLPPALTGRMAKAVGVIISGRSGPESLQRDAK
ncbi:hypothetical protein AO716_15500 [Arthrobacter sp. Edens01]|nr:hypothetical protein AO716_15500 [Arthrobacter sp. Edens01]